MKGSRSDNFCHLKIIDYLGFMRLHHRVGMLMAVTDCDSFSRSTSQNWGRPSSHAKIFSRIFLSILFYFEILDAKALLVINYIISVIGGNPNLLDYTNMCELIENILIIWEALTQRSTCASDVSFPSLLFLHSTVRFMKLIPIFSKFIKSQKY